MSRMRYSVGAVVCLAIMVLGALLQPSVSATTSQVYPDLSFFASTVMVDSTWGAGFNEWSCPSGPDGTSMGLYPCQVTQSGGIGTATLSTMHECRTQSFYCDVSLQYVLEFWWHATWVAGWNQLINLYGTASAQVAIYIGADIWDTTTSQWVSRGDHDLKIIDERDTDKAMGWPTLPDHESWSVESGEYSIIYAQNLVAGHTYIFYTPVYTTTYASAVGQAFADSYINFVGSFHAVLANDQMDVGCVAEGTMIAMADGSEIPVEKLMVGDEVLGYDPVTEVFMAQTVSDTWSTKVEQILNINDGALRVTLVDQPMYVMNTEGFAMWLQDPMELRIGWMLYSPETGVWVAIDCLVVEDGKTKVYDFLTDGFQTYIGNSFLLMDKGHKK